MSAPVHSAAPLRRPLIGLAASYLTGALIGLRYPHPAWGFVAAGAALAATVVARQAARRHRRAHRASVATTHAFAASVAAVATALAVCQRQTELSTLREMLEAGENVVLRGTVVGEPAGQRLPRGGACLRFDLRVIAIPDDFGGQRPRPFLIPVEWYGPTSIVGRHPSRPMPTAGEGWQLEGRLRDATFRQGPPRYELSVRPGPNQRWPAGDAPRWQLLCAEVRRQAAERLTVGIDHSQQAAAILRAMILGYRGEMPADLRSIFATSGTIHIFAISGMHVAILAGLIIALLPMTGVSKTHWAWLLVPILILYTYLTGNSPSALRACVMSLLFFGAPIAGRKPDALSALAAAALGLLAYSPLMLTDLGFLLSFACVLGLLTLGPGLVRLWSPDAPPDASSADDLIQRALLASGAPATEPSPLTRLRRAWLPARRYVTTSIAISFAASLASIPITAVCFGNIPVISILSNLLAIPLSTGIVLCGSLSLVGGLLSPWIAETFNCASLALIEVLVAATRLSVRVPGSSIATAPWPPWAVVLWYVACLALAVRIRIALRRRDDAAHLAASATPPAVP